ncbi:MAG TPA: CocE/NonD family hydrolase C-terminal non-catalytic domain-containing protein, partial [Actinomycetota bacterium]|nr:CocE/NonD family hydrolase C-terminal non-catalytic domain-containing protein [Actinomycetota bacterium]
LLSDRTRDGQIYRPHRPHTNPRDIMPGETYEYLVEIFPVGHVFRPGHKLVVKIHTPPIADSYYVYVPKRFPGVNTVFHNAENPSHLTLPLIPASRVRLGPELPPCSLQEIRCIPG